MDPQPEGLGFESGPAKSFRVTVPRCGSPSRFVPRGPVIPGQQTACV
jgi:hypothetical protein